MAKPSHAAEGTGAPGKRRSPSPMNFSPELLVDGRRRYEQTSEPLYAIAADFGIHRTTFTDFAQREGWVRFRPSPRQLSAAARVLAQTERLEAEASTLCLPATGGAGIVVERAGEAEVPDIAASVDWLHREVRGQIAAVEALRARATGKRQTAQEAAVISRTLVALTGALHKLQRMTCGASQTGQNDDELPDNIDDFRNELARRIRAFVASRTGTGDAGRVEPVPPMDAVRE